MTAGFFTALAGAASVRVPAQVDYGDLKKALI